MQRSGTQWELLQCLQAGLDQVLILSNRSSGLMHLAEEFALQLLLLKKERFAEMLDSTSPILLPTGKMISQHILRLEI